MGFWSQIRGIFNKDKKSDEDKSKKTCGLTGCHREPENLCPFCGKMFCEMHKDPIDHECHKRKLAKSNKKRNTPTSFEGDNIEVPQAPELDDSNKK